MIIVAWTLSLTIDISVHQRPLMVQTSTTLPQWICNVQEHAEQPGYMELISRDCRRC